MERIVLKVGDEAARAWRNTTPGIRTEIGKTIELLLNVSLKKTKDTNFELLLKEARLQAADNGLTEEILDKLLNEKER